MARLIVVVDYGMGNVGSIINMIKKVGGRAELSAGPEDISKADKLILPGVGAFDTGMKNLHERHYVEPLTEKALNTDTPVLGICLGMQLLTERSEEGSREGLGWIDAETVRFNFAGSDNPLKVPHMGWNEITVNRPHPLFEPAEARRRFYFVHSYHVCCNDPADVLAVSHYGRDFTAAVARDNIIGTQFHPEKSHKYGMELMRNFVHNI